MVSLIIGEKGKGKTKVLLDKVNEEIKDANGSYVYLDKSSQHMYELNNKVRLIDVSSYDLDNADKFLGFISGIVSQDHDLEKMYLDNFLVLSNCGDDYIKVLDSLNAMSEKYKVNFIVSMSKVKADLNDTWKNNVIAEL